jgi:hypothetical protein
MLYAFMTLVINDMVVAPTTNALINSSIVSNMGQQSTNSLHFAIGMFAVIAFIFASLMEIQVANARSEMNSPLIVSSWIGTVVCAMTITVAMVCNLGTTIILDPLMITASTPFIGWMMNTPFEPIIGGVNGLFNASHLLWVFFAAIGFLYMIIASVQRESLGWLTGV